MCNNESMYLIDVLTTIANPIYVLGILEEEQLRYNEGSLEYQQLQTRINKIEDSIQKEEAYYEQRSTGSAR